MAAHYILKAQTSAIAQKPQVHINFPRRALHISEITCFRGRIMTHNQEIRTFTYRGYVRLALPLQPPTTIFLFNQLKLIQENLFEL